MASHRLSEHPHGGHGRLLARLAMGGALLVAIAIAVLVLSGMDARPHRRHASPARSAEVRTARREKDMAKLAQWREVRRQARACANRGDVSPGGAGEPCPSRGDGEPAPATPVTHP